MSRNTILNGLRAALRARPGDAGREAAVDDRLRGAGPGHIVPARARGRSAAERVAAFVELAGANGATVERVPGTDAVPGAVADYLAHNNLPARVRLAPAPWLGDLPWAEHPLLEVSAGAARADDPASVTPCFAAIAETGTLMLLSGPDSPTTLNFLPETHIAVVRASEVVGPVEEAIVRLRARGVDYMPRAVNFISGPSRTADIEQTMYMGAHGPKRLHIVIVDEADGRART
jgi:L-lactate dehydrogenase complex protein LldG